MSGTSAITRMELLGFPGMTPAEEHLIRSTLDQFRYLAITGDVEDAAIRIRRTRRAKLPDALIASQALTVFKRSISVIGCCGDSWKP